MFSSIAGFIPGVPSIALVIIVAFVAGALGTTIGGALGVIVKKPKRVYVGAMLAFAAGAMLGMALFEMLPHAVEYGDELFGDFEYGGLIAAVVGLVFGGGVIFLYNFITKRMKEKKKLAEGVSINEFLGAKKAPAQDAEQNVVGQDMAEQNVAADCQICQENATNDSNDKNLPHLAVEQTDLIEAKKEKKLLFKVGITIFVAIILHDLPEGLAIGVAYSEYSATMLVLGIAMFLHNVPEGLAIAVPLKASGMANWKIIGITFLAGVPTLLGALLGYWLLGLADAIKPFALAFSAGIMLYIVFQEMLPVAYKYTKKNTLTTILVLVGISMIVLFATLLH